MPKLTVNASQRRALGVAIVIALIGGALFLARYLSLVILAAIMAYLFSPVYRRRLAKSKSGAKASVYTLTVAAFTVLIPLTLVVVVSIWQINHILSTVNLSSLGQAQWHLLDAFNNLMHRIGLSFQLDQASIQTAIQDALKKFSQSLVAAIPHLFSNFFGFFTTAIIFLYVFLSMLRNQDKLQETFIALNPLGKQISELYITRIKAMTRAMVRGQFIIAVLQGLTDASLLALAGLPNLFFFFFLILTALSIIPLGGGIVAIPIGIVMMLTGNFWGGALVVFGHIIIVTNIDNVLRPKLVPAEAKLDGALTILSVFAGLGIFGFLGIVVGPVIMIAIVTTIQVFLEVYRDIQMEDAAKHKEHEGILHKLSDTASKLFNE